MLRRPLESTQYVSIRYTERLAAAGIEPSVGSVGDSFDNALAETINGLYKAEVIHRRGPWRSFEAVEFAMLEWVDWFNHRRLLEPIGNVPPAEAEARYYAQMEVPARAARSKPKCLRETRRGSARTTASVCGLSWQDRVVPVAVKRGGLKIKGGHLGIGHPGRASRRRCG